MPELPGSERSVTRLPAHDPWGPAANRQGEVPAAAVTGFSEAVQDLVLDSVDIAGYLTVLAQESASTLAVEGRDLPSAVVLLRPRKKAVVGASSAHAKAVGEVQFRFDDGPCLRAAREGAPCLVRDFRTETRFGGYAQQIISSGIRSALAVPIPLDGGALAALDLYSSEVDVFDTELVRAAEHLAQDASRALRTAVRIAHLDEAMIDLRTAMETRATIQIAAGIIMGQNRCTHERAMMILKAASSSRNTPLNEIAARVVHSLNQEQATPHFDS